MIINYFLILIVLLLISGLALDAGLLEWQQLHLQNAADSAAQEGMYQLARADTNWAIEAQAQATANGYTTGTNNTTVSLRNPPTTAGSYLGNTLAVQATISQSVNNLFMGLVNGGKSTIAATAIAQEIPTCIWIMNPTGNTSGGQLDLASARISANCGVYVNTATGDSLLIDGFATLDTLRTRVVGNASSGTASTGSIYPQPIYSAAIKTDPLAYLTAPTITSCTYNAKTYSSVTTTLSPSTFCGGTTMNNSTITLNPGTYIFADGLNTSGTTITGTGGVTLYFTKHTSASYTASTLNNSTLYLKAPILGASVGIPGIVIFVDRGWIAHGSHSINFNFSNVSADGIWYMLNTGLYLWSTPTSGYKYIGWVIDNVYQFGATTYLGSDYTDLGGVSPLRYEDGVLVQ